MEVYEWVRRMSQRTAIPNALKASMNQPNVYTLDPIGAALEARELTIERKPPAKNNKTPKAGKKATPASKPASKKAPPSVPRKRPASEVSKTQTESKPDSSESLEKFQATGGPDSTAQENDNVEQFDEGTQVSSTLNTVLEQPGAGPDSPDSDLSELGTTPPPPARDPYWVAFDLEPQPKTVSEQLDENTIPFNRGPASPNHGTTAVNTVVEPTTEPPLSQEMKPGPSSMAEPTLKLLLEAPVSDGLATATHTVPITPTSLRQSGRSRTQLPRLDNPVPTPIELGQEQVSVDEAVEKISGIDSPTVQKVSRGRKSNTAGSNAKTAPSRQQPAAVDKLPLVKGAVAKSVRAKKPVSSEKVSEEDLADDVPDPPGKKPSRKRKAETSTTTPRKRATKASTTSNETFEVKPKVRKTPVQRKSKEKTPVSQKNALQLPSPPMSTSDYLEASGVHIDPDLLALSGDLTYREPLEKKPAPCGKPEVWAPGRQELCETLPYDKSAHSGCYSNGNTVYSFMFDSAGVGREYMDQDVIIARMGGGMESDETKVVSQKADHEIEAKQPQSVMNNITHKNPIVIICGDKNTSAITTMPYRYCVLGWFEPTHVWVEKTSSKKRTMTTIRYRFERLDTSKPSWYRPVSTDAKAVEPPTGLALPVKTCITCSKSCLQVYLIDWMCKNPKCTAFWEMSNGQDAPYGDLDYHPAFLLHRTKWEREDPPFSLNPGVPQIGHHFGDNLSLVNTKGIVCPDCGRCNSRYMFTYWRCDTPGCRWKLQPKHEIVMPSNLSHTPWEMPSDGPSLIKSTTAPVIRTQVKYYSNYKVIKYTIEGIAGAVIVAKANTHVVSEPGGADDMFRDMQTADVGLERRMLRKTAVQQTDQPGELSASTVAGEQTLLIQEEADEHPNVDDEDGDDDEHNAEAGMRMNAFGMNFGMPYKFIASGDSRSFEEAPDAVKTARSLLNWAQRVFVNDDAGYQDFNEELVFAYMDGQRTKYHDDGEMGLGPRIATLSLGGAATMLLRVKAKYYGQVSNIGVFTYEKPLPLPLLESSGYTSGFRGKKVLKPCKDTHDGRYAAWKELKKLKETGDGAGFRKRSKELSKELDLKKTPGETLLTFHLTHGDIVIIEGEEIQKYLEHQVEPTGSLRFALTCRTVLGNHLPPDQLPKYDVSEAALYDGSAIRESGDGEAVVWD